MTTDIPAYVPTDATAVLRLLVELERLRAENAALRKTGTVLSKQTFLQMACSCPWDENGNPTHCEPCTGWSPSTDSSHAAIEAWEALTGPSQEDTP